MNTKVRWAISNSLMVNFLSILASVYRQHSYVVTTEVLSFMKYNQNQNVGFYNLSLLSKFTFRSCYTKPICLKHIVSFYGSFYRILFGYWGTVENALQKHDRSKVIALGSRIGIPPTDFRRKLSGVFSRATTTF